MDDEQVQQQEQQGTWLDDSRFQWPDGAITHHDADGNEVDPPTADDIQSGEPTGNDDNSEQVDDIVFQATDDERTQVQQRVQAQEEVASQPVAQVEAARTVTPASQPVQQPVQTQNGPIFTQEWLQSQIYTEAVLEELGTLQLTDPVAFLRKNLALQNELTRQTQQLTHYASNKFDEDLAAVTAVAKDSVNLFRAQIESEKRNLSPEQLQQPGIARRVVAKVVSDHFTRDPLAMEEAVKRAIAGGSQPVTTVTTVATPPSRPAPTRQPIPVEERSAGPGSVRRSAPRRAQSGETSGLEKRIRGLTALYPRLDREEIKRIAEAELASETERKLRAHA